MRLCLKFEIDTPGAFCDEGFGPAGNSSKPQRKNIMNWKNFFIAFIAAFGFIFLFGFVWYGKLMHGAHQEVPTLWRSEADFGHHFSALVFGHIVMAFFLTVVCARFVWFVIKEYRRWRTLLPLIRELGF